MKNKQSLLIGVTVFIVLMVAVYGLYTVLAKNYAPESNLAALGGTNSGETSIAESTDLPETVTDSAEIMGESTSSSDETTETEVYPAPDFTVFDYDGNQVKLSDFVGKPVVLNFWASWCGPCKSEMPEFESAYTEYGEDIAFMMVNLTGNNETAETAHSFIADLGYTFPVYYDSYQQGAMFYGVTSIPATYFIDKDGNLAAYGIGALDGETLEYGIGMIYGEETTEIE